jgi:hypothetical protein
MGDTALEPAAPRLRLRSRRSASAQEDGGSVTRRGLIWLAGIAVLFTLAVLLFTPLRVSLAWDENVYASQISHHLPIMVWSSERARGLPLLIAPVTLATSSTLVLRVYLSLLSGIGLFLALLSWRRVKPDWVLALAGLVFGGLWIAQSQASQVYPNFWIALGGLAGAGLFLRIMTGAGGRGSLVWLAVAAAFTSLMRPPDSVALFGPLLAIAVLTVVLSRAEWRAQLRKVAAGVLAIVAGLVIGIGEWVVEAYLYFRGPLHRLSAENHAVGGTKFNLTNSLRIISGGRASSVPGYPSLHGWSDPWLLLWWLAFMLIALAGVVVTWRAKGWLVAVTPALCAAAGYLLYAFPARDNTRYLLPSWALLAIPAADGLAWLLTRPKGSVRLAAVGAAAAFLLVELVTQHAVLNTQSAALRTLGRQNVSTGNSLRQLGVRSPCLVTSDKRPHFVDTSEPAAYNIGCSYLWTMHNLAKAKGSRVVVLVQGGALPFPYAQGWPSHRLSGPGDVVAYIQPHG